MNALEVSTDAIHAAECVAYRHEGRNAQCERSARAVLTALTAAGWVVATPEEIRAWPVERVAELIGGEVHQGWLPVRGLVNRTASPWREVRDV